MNDLLYDLETYYFQNKSLLERFNLIKEYINIDLEILNLVDNYGNTIFHYLVKFGDFDLLNILISLIKITNYKINFKLNNYSQTPLFMLKDIRNPNDKINEIKSIIKLLVLNGCNANKRDENNKLFYFYCANFAQYYVFEELNELNLTYDKADISDGKNVLHMALESLNSIKCYINNESRYQKEEIPYLKTIHEIVKSSIDINKKTNIGKTAYDFALETKNKEAVRILYGLPENDMSYGITLCDAAMYGYDDIVKYYIENHHLLDIPYNGYHSELSNLRPIDLAAKNLQTEIIKLLIESDNKLNSINSITGKSPFYYFVKSLIISKVSILGDISKEKYLQISKLFFKNEKFINSYVDDFYNTPINLLASLASRFNYVDNCYAEMIIFNELIKYNLDLSIADINGNTVLHNLFKNSCKHAADMLEALLSYKLDFNQKNKDGLTALMLLATVYRESDSLLMLEVISNLNIDINVVNNDNKTVLTLLLENDKEEVAKKIIELWGERYE